MELDEVKQIIDTYKAAGKTREETIEMVSGLPLNGDHVKAFEYVDDTFSVEAVVNDFNLTDAGNAEYFTQEYRDILRYDHQRSRWLEWNTHCWKPENDGHVGRLALKSTRKRYKEAVNVADLDQRGKIAKWAISSEQRARLDACIALAKDFKPIADSGEDWDKDNWLFCLSNGVVDLRTGELRPGKQSDRITMQSPVVFDVNAKCSRWLQFLDEVFSGDQELIDWLQRYLGYCLTGDTTEQTVAIPYGNGANGKSKFLAALRYVWGDYAYDAPFSTFELSQRAAIPNDLAALAGKRLVTSSETNEGTRLNEARIKSLTGCDSVTARFLHAEYFSFTPVAKFFLAVNHRPRVQDDSYGFWRRVRLIPFTRQFVGESDDKNLLDKLTAEASGVLNWLIEGCLLWQKQGLDPTPESVQRATAEYQTDSDPLSQFILEKCAINSQAQVKASALYRSYINWCEEQGFKEREQMTANAFGRRMAQKFKKMHDRTGTFYQGVGLECDGFVTEFERNNQKNNVFLNFNSHVGENLENTSHSVTTFNNPSQQGLFEKNPSQPVNELPDCPKCGKNEWSFGAAGEMICPCGYIKEEK